MRCVYCGRAGTKRLLVKRALGFACPNWQACAARQAARNEKRATA